MNDAVAYHRRFRGLLYSSVPGGHSAIESDDENPDTGQPFYRYELIRRVAPDVRTTVVFVGLNPSTANAISDDATMRREIDFARHWGYGLLVKVNLCAYRATDPAAMLSAATARRRVGPHPPVDREHRGGPPAGRALHRDLHRERARHRPHPPPGWRGARLQLPLEAQRGPRGGRPSPAPRSARCGRRRAPRS